MDTVKIVWSQCDESKQLLHVCVVLLLGTTS